jgi:hypothetical protein
MTRLMNPADSMKLNYTQRFVAFIDVLGFGSAVSESGKTPAVAKRLIKRVLDAILGSIEELEEQWDIAFTHFSDSIVLSIKVSKQPHDIIMFSLMILGVIDCFLASNFLLRGGITRGQLIHNDKLLFGPAMNRAYELESDLARYPRIIIDPDLPESTYIMPSHWLNKDEDGLLYINYFAPKKAFYLIPGWLYCIQQTIEAMPLTSELDEKRAWLVEKYNEEISHFSYDKFKSRLDDKVDDTPIMAADYEEFLRQARKLHHIQ